MQFPPVPLPLQETSVKFMFSATLVAIMAGAVCAPMPVALIALVALGTLIVPPDVAENAVPFEVVIPRLPKLIVPPVFVARLTPAPPVVVLVTFTEDAKLTIVP